MDDKPEYAADPNAEIVAMDRSCLIVRTYNQHQVRGSDACLKESLNFKRKL